MKFCQLSLAYQALVSERGLCKSNKVANPCKVFFKKFGKTLFEKYGNFFSLTLRTSLALTNLLLFTASASTGGEESNTLYSVAFSPDDSRLASGSLNNTIKIWDATITVNTSTIITTLSGHNDDVNSVAHNHNCSRLAVMKPSRYGGEVILIIETRTIT